MCARRCYCVPTCSHRVTTRSCSFVNDQNQFVDLLLLLFGSVFTAFHAFFQPLHTNCGISVAAQNKVDCPLNLVWSHLWFASLHKRQGPGYFISEPSVPGKGRAIYLLECCAPLIYGKHFVAFTSPKALPKSRPTSPSCSTSRMISGTA